MKFFSFLIIFSLVVSLLACKASNLEEDTQTSYENPTGAAERFSDAEFNSLPPLQQYQVANKLKATFYKGIKADEFFDLTAGTENLKTKSQQNLISNTANNLKQHLRNKEAYVARLESRFVFTRRDNDTKAAEHKPSAEPLATIHLFPESRDLMESWMAYTLANTILFSPAAEIDSASYIDVQNIYSGLTDAMNSGKTIREIIFTHMKSEANWRRFRSPEDNTREMIEIYLGLFDRDEDVPKASLACKDWSITDDEDGYQLQTDKLKENREPQYVLDQWVTSCEDFYQVVASHPLVIPRITTVLVDKFFPDASSEKRAALVQSIANTNPSHFFDIFTAIIFSREYLLNSQKPKNLEETFFNLAERIHWEADKRFFYYLTDPDQGASFPTLHKMKQPAMTLKLGRWMTQPLDSLSFAYYHEAIREQLLIKRKTESFRSDRRGWTTEYLKAADFLEKDQFINYLFISVLARKTTDDELSQLNTIISEGGHEKDFNAIAMIILDYLSRLPELYYFRAVK